MTKISLEEDGRGPRGSVSPDEVCLLGPVDAEEQLGGLEVAQVLHTVRAGVLVVVPAFPVVAEAVRVLHAQVEALPPHRPVSNVVMGTAVKSHGMVYPNVYFGVYLTDIFFLTFFSFSPTFLSIGIK